MKKKNNHHLFSLFLLPIFLSVHSLSSSPDASVMQDLKKSINPPGWTDPDPCKWNCVQCSKDGRVTRIQIGHKDLKGTLPPNLNALTALQVFEVQYNQLTGPVPDLSGLSSIQTIILTNNSFTSIPSNFFTGMSSLQVVYLDYNPFSPWSIPDSVGHASKLRTFSAIYANITGKLPGFFGDNLSGLTNLHLAFNFLEGGLPPSFSGSSIQSLWLNGQQSKSKLNGSIDVLRNMTQLCEVWLHSNSFSGSLPDLSGLKQLKSLSLRDNSFTGPVPVSLLNICSLKIVNLTNNMLQGPTPVFKSSVEVDMVAGTNSFCLSNPGVHCDPRVNTLLDIAQSVGYPKVFGENWKGNDPCAKWLGITCSNGNIFVVNFQNIGLKGVISPNFSSITSLQRLILSNNNLTGTIPNELSSLANLRELDVLNNTLYGKIPSFSTNVTVKVAGNVNIGKDSGPTPTPGRLGSASPLGHGTDAPGNKTYSIGVIVCLVVGGVCAVLVVGLLVFCVCKARCKCSGIKNYPSLSSDEDALMIIVGGGGFGGSSVSDSAKMVIPFQVLKDVTNNFSQKNVLGKGGFGTVYEGVLSNGTKIAVKRMESAVMEAKGLDEFKSEISVLTKVRHKNLVALLGYCFEGNERLLVYEYVPQGTLSRFLFYWTMEGLKPLQWTKRLVIALDVAKAVEYLHSLAGQTFIHRDLKPSNILLGDDMRAKVADFGLVRLAPEGKDSVRTKLAGTFGYLAPEYAVTGRITTKVDVYSFGVILMELITGRRALDVHQGEDSVLLVPWFQRMQSTNELFCKAIDPKIDVDEETRTSIDKIAELAGHCCSRDPYQRPDMGHVVNVLSSQADGWKPSDPVSDEFDPYASFLQAVEQCQPREGMNCSGGSFSSGRGNSKNNVSGPSSGFGDSSTSTDDSTK